MSLYEKAGFDPKDHFAHISKMVVLGSGAKREIDDIALTHKKSMPRKICRNSSKVRMATA